MQKGMTLPNAQWRHYTDQEVAALEDLQPSVLVWLLYGQQGPLDIDAVHQQQLQPFLNKHHPRIIYRVYADNIASRDPKEWAKHCYDVIQWMEADGSLIPANELNIEGMGEDWQRQITWLTAFEKAWREECAMPVHLPALSPAGNWLDGLHAYRKTGVDKLFDQIDCHAYGPNAADTVTFVAGVFAGRLLDVTEFNQIDPLAFANLNPPCESATYFLLGGTPDQQAFDILKQPDAYQSFKAWRPTLAEYDSPNHGGVRPSTVGVVLHATLSDKNITVQQEYDATCNYFRDPTSQVSAHAVVGPSGQVHYPVRLDLEAWHCLQANDTHAGIEMAKSHLADPLRDDILEETAQVVAGWCKTYNIPVQWSITHGIAEHREMPGNNHQDVGGPFDRADFLNRVKHYAKEDELTDAQKKAVLDDLDFLWAYSKADQIVKNPAESERILHERIVALKVTLGLNG